MASLPIKLALLHQKLFTAKYAKYTKDNLAAFPRISCGLRFHVLGFFAPRLRVKTLHLSAFSRISRISRFKFPLFVLVAVFQFLRSMCSLKINILKPLLCRKLQSTHF